jgi:hypothetical protein
VNLELIIERLLGRGVGWWALVRVLVWTLLFVAVIGHFFPKPAQPAGKVHMERSDGFSMILENRQLEDKAIKFNGDNGRLRLAWIGASESQLGTNIGEMALSLPMITADRLAEIRDGNVNVYYYLQNGGRFLDVYTFLLDALERDPDVVVITVNPIWTYSDIGMFGNTTVFDNRSDLWFSSTDWPLWLGVTSPSSHFLTHVGNRVPLVMAPETFRREVNAAQERMFGKPLAQAKGKVSHEYFYDRDSPIGFWLNQTTTRSNNPRPDLKKDPQWLLRQYQADILERANTSTDSFAAVTFRKIDKLLAKKRVPILFFRAPMSPRVEDDLPAAEGYERVAMAIEALEQNKSGDNMKFVARIPQPVLNSMLFIDMIHASDFGTLDDYLAKQIDALLRAQQ